MSNEFDDPTDEFRTYVVMCGKAHISVNDMYRFTYEEANVVKKNLESRLKEKLSGLDEDDKKTRDEVEWKLSTLRVKELVLN